MGAHRIHCHWTAWSSAVIPSICCKTLLLNAVFLLAHTRISLAQQALPITTGTASALLANINNLRAGKNGILMECIRHWNWTLAAYAQEVANNCSTVPPTNLLHPVAISAADDDNPSNAFTSIDEIGIFYDSATRACSADFSPQQCQNFVQLYRFDINQTGCAKSRCDTITPAGPPNGQNNIGPILWVCAFDVSAPMDQPPFLELPNTLPCMQCPSSKSLCDASTNNLCCDAPVFDLIVSQDAAQAAGCGAMPPLETRTNVSRYYDNSMRTNILAFENLPGTFPSDLETSGNKYTRLGPVGSVVSHNATVPECPYLKEIRHLYSPILKQNLYLIDEVEIRRRLEEGHQSRGVVGYAVPGYQMCEATIAMYRFFNPSINAVQLSNITDVDLVLRGMPPGYQWEGISFYLWDP
uniref:SCP domain-containing protein n=1 Tax=Trichuris muris TaxID=70415 RepID=A0A5S6QRR2_TRIMR